MIDKRYAVMVRNQYGLMSEVVVEAANTFMAQKAALALHPYSRIVRIAPAEPDWDGKDW
jgi:hypothetical protein